MVVHTIELTTATDVDEQTARDAVQAWVGNHTERLPDESVAFTVGNTTMDASTGTDFYRVLYRFDSTTDDKIELKDSLLNRLAEYVSWYRLRYHVCDHDSDSPGGCSWDGSEERSGGTVPGDL